MPAWLIPALKAALPHVASIVAAASPALAEGSANEAPTTASAEISERAGIQTTGEVIFQDIAVVPFLWVLPLVLYLLTFILCFESTRWYSRRWFVLATVVSPLVAQTTPTRERARAQNRLGWEQMSAESWESAAKYFQNAIDVDPTFALPEVIE